MGEVTLTWTAPAGTVTGYQVRQSTDGGANYGAWRSGTSTLTTYTAVGLSPTLTYTFQVRAVNSLGFGPAATTDPITAVSTSTANSPPTFSTEATWTLAENTTAVGVVVAEDRDRADAVTGVPHRRGRGPGCVHADLHRLAGLRGGAELREPHRPGQHGPGRRRGNNVYVVVVEAASGASARAMTGEQTLMVTVTDAAEPPSAPGELVFASATANSVRLEWGRTGNHRPRGRRLRRPVSSRHQRGVPGLEPPRRCPHRDDYRPRRRHRLHSQGAGEQR